MKNVEFKKIAGRFRISTLFLSNDIDFFLLLEFDIALSNWRNTNSM